MSLVAANEALANAALLNLAIAGNVKRASDEELRAIYIALAEIDDDFISTLERISAELSDRRIRRMVALEEREKTLSVGNAPG